MKNPENKRYFKLGLTGAGVVVFGLLFYFFMFRFPAVAAGAGLIAGILMPFLYGAVIAYILTPLCNKLERLLTRLWGRQKSTPGLAILLSLLLALLLLGVLVMLVLPQLWASIVSLANALPGQLAAANTWLHDLLAEQPDLQAYWDEFSGELMTGINGWLKTDLLPSVGTVIGEVGSQVAVFFGAVKNLFLGLLISIYFLGSRRQFAAQSRLLLHGALPRRWAALIEEEVHYADKMFNGFLMGKLLDSAIIGVICFAGSLLLGFESAVLISVIVGVTNIIPFFGPFLGAIPCALLLLMENPMHCVYFLIFVVVLQQLDGNVIGPKILGDSTGLSSFWVMFAILLFGGLWGIAGMIVGVPLFAVIYDVIRRLTFHGLARHENRGMLEEYQSAYHPEQATVGAEK